MKKDSRKRTHEAEGNLAKFARDLPVRDDIEYENTTLKKLTAFKKKMAFSFGV